MAINYQIFEFAAPPSTAVDWFIKSVQLCGFGPGFGEHAYAPFPEKRESQNTVRIS